MTTGAESPFDPGLQPERTALAWRRTVLSLAVASLASLKVLFPVLGVAALAVGTAGVSLSALLWVLGERRYRLTHRLLTATRDSRPALPSAVPLAICAILVTGLGLTALAFVLLERLTD